MAGNDVKATTVAVSDQKVAEAPKTVTPKVVVAPKTYSFKQALAKVGCSHVWLRRMITERGYFDAKKADGVWVLSATKVDAYAKYFREREQTKPAWM